MYHQRKLPYMSLATEAAEILTEFRRERDSNERDEEDTHGLWQETKQELTELFLQEDWDLSERTIRKEVHEALDPFYRPSDDDELERYFQEVIDDLRTETQFSAYLYFPELVEMPVGKEIGDLEIIEKPEDRDRLMERMNNSFQGHEHYTRLYEGRTWAKFEFKSYKRRAYIEEELFDELQEVLGVLKVAIGKTATPQDLAGAIDNNEGLVWYLTPDHEPSGWTRYDERIAEPTLSGFSDMLSKERGERTPLEENILGSLQLLNLHSKNYRNQHSFLTLVAALEGLLLTKYERPKAGKMAEKTVQLLSPNREELEAMEEEYDVSDKIEFYYHVKDWYQKRSEIIHGGFRSITREEVRNIERTVERVARELVRLSDEYYSIQKQGGENNPYKGLNEMFLESRLDTPSVDSPEDNVENTTNSE